MLNESVCTGVFAIYSSVHGMQNFEANSLQNKPLSECAENATHPHKAHASLGRGSCPALTVTS